MSKETDLQIDLEQLFLPDWATKSPDSKRFLNYEGEPEERPRRGGRQGGRPQGRGGDGPRGPRPQGDRGPRPQGDRGPRPQGDRGPRPQGDRGPRPQGNRGPRGRGFGGRDSRPRTEERPLPPVDCNLVPDPRGVDILAKQIRLSGRAYPLFDIGRLVLQKEDRYQAHFKVQKKDGEVVQPLFLCNLDDTLFLSEAEAVAYLLDKHFDTFYQSNKIETDPPKGTHTFVAQCGMTGEILGPPNYHNYQSKLMKLHQAKFSNMPFETFKSRVKIVKDEEVVKKWIEEQSFRTEYICLNQPEPLTLNSRAEVDKHFRETHLPAIVSEVQEYTIPASTARSQPCVGLRRLYLSVSDDQRHFPLKLVNVLSQQFAGHGLQFFKVNKTVTHVCVARPRFLDLETNPVKDGIRRIIGFIDTHEKCTRPQLITALAGTKAKPAPAPEAQPAAEPEAVAPAEAPEAAPVEVAEAPATEAVETPAPAPETEATEATETAPVAEAPAPKPAPKRAELTPEEAAISNDLHWLIHEGHVIEFANGILETAKMPKNPAPQTPRQPKAKKQPANKSAATEAPADSTSEAATTSTGEAAATPAPAADEEPTQPAEEATAPAVAADEEPTQPAEVAPAPSADEEPTQPAEVTPVQAADEEPTQPADTETKPEA